MIGNTNAKKEAEQVASKVWSFRCTQAEFDRWEASAEKSGLSKTDYSKLKLDWEI